MHRAAALVMTVFLLVSACGWPRDTSSTLSDVRNGLLRVGVSESPPWTVVPDEGEPRGAEVQLVERLAHRLGARVEWYPGSESELMAALHDRVLDLVIGGLESDAPWTRHASLTKQYVTVRTLVAAPPGVTVPDDLDGVRVAVPAGTAEVAALVGEKAEVVPVPEVTGDEGMAVVVDEWQLDGLGLAPTGHEIAEHDHVWAVPPGENAWQVEVEGFLLDLRQDEVTALLAEAEEAR
jgi:ABC-type amino acid transport substrate-binding protein